MRPMIKYRRSPKGVLTVLYSKMKERSRKNNLPSLDFSLNEFHHMFIESESFKNLYKLWVDSDFNKMNKPSIDRHDPDLGYSKENIRLMTWYENRIKGDKENAERITTSVIKFDLNGNKICEYESVKEAVEKTGLNQSSIVMCCQGKRNHTGGFIFKYRGDKFRKKHPRQSISTERRIVCTQKTL